MISLAGRDILHSWGKFVFTGLGLGLLIGVTLIMAGVYRGMVDDGQALLDNSGADLWVVQQDTQGPYAESSSLADDAWRMVRSVPGVAEAANVTYFTMQVRRTATGQEVRAMVFQQCKYRDDFGFCKFLSELNAARLERSSFYETKWNKKAGVEDGKSRPN